MKRRFRRLSALHGACAALAGGGLLTLAAPAVQAQLPLNTGKKITQPAAGTPLVQVGNMPSNLTLSPDRKWAVATSTGNQEYLSVINPQTGALVSQVPANRSVGGAGPLPGLYYGLAFAPNADGNGNYTLYAALGGAAGIAVLSLNDTTGALTYTSTIQSLNQPASLAALGALAILQPTGDFPSGLATDASNNLYVANNTAYAFVNGLTPVATVAGYPYPTITFGAPSAQATAALPINYIVGVGYVYLNMVYPHGSLSIINPSTGHELGRYNFFTDLTNGYNGTVPASTYTTAGHGGSSALPNGPGLYNYPLAVAALSNGSKCYVGSQRDDAVYVLNTGTPTAITLKTTLTTGSHPVALLFNQTQTTLYVANASSDTISVVNTATDTVTQTINLRPTGALSLPGVTPIGLALSPDQSTLYAALADMNAIAVINIANGQLQGYIPTGWYPSSVAAVNSNLLISNAKGTVLRHPNPNFQTQINPEPAGYDPTQSDHVSLISNIETIPVPSSIALLKDTLTVYANNLITPTTDHPTSNPLASIGLQSTAPQHIKHIIYMIKENRTYDQVLGDLGTTPTAAATALGLPAPSAAVAALQPVNGVSADLSITLFGWQVTPNQHALSSRFLTMDNFFNAGEVSDDGWPWCTGSFANENVQKSVPYNYSGRGRQSDSTGQSNGYLVGGWPATDVDGNLLSTLFPYGAPAIKDVGQAPNGHIWDLVNAKGLTYRNYGFFISQGAAPLLPDNFPCVPGVAPAGHYNGGPLTVATNGRTDYDFRQFDLNYADSDAPGQTVPTATYGKYAAKSRFTEWNREFQLMVAADPVNFRSVPQFMTVRFMRDHTNGFGAGNGTPTALVADNDYAVGELVQAISQYPALWDSTAIFIVEDDSQDGPDHIDCHRSPAQVISPWIKAHSLDHTFYNTDSILHTMELLMGLPAMSQYDAIATPIMDWDTAPNNNAPFSAIQPAAAYIDQKIAKNISPRDPRYKLVRLTAKMDLKHADSADPRMLNEIIWKSVKGMKSKMPAPKHSLGVVEIAEAHNGKGATAHRTDDDD